MSGTMPHLISRIDEARVRRDVADVGAERDLEAAAKGVPMDRGDHRNGKCAPDVSRLLPGVGDAMGAGHQIVEPGRTAVSEDRCERLLVEARAEAASRAGEDNGAQAGRPAQPLSRRNDRLEHKRIERVELVRAIERDLGDSVRDCDLYAVARRRRGFALHAALPGFVKAKQRG